MAPWFQPAGRMGVGVFVPPSAAEPWISAPASLHTLEADRSGARLPSAITPLATYVRTISSRLSADRSIRQCGWRSTSGTRLDGALQSSTPRTRRPDRQATSSPSAGYAAHRAPRAAAIAGSRWRCPMSPGRPGAAMGRARAQLRGLHGRVSSAPRRRAPAAAAPARPRRRQRLAELPRRAGGALRHSRSTSATTASTAWAPRRPSCSGPAGGCASRRRLRRHSRSATPASTSRCSTPRCTTPPTSPRVLAEAARVVRPGGRIADPGLALLSPRGRRPGHGRGEESPTRAAASARGPRR